MALRLTFSGLAKVAIFTTNVDAENQTLINYKCVCGALNRHFCQTRVIASAFFGRHCYFSKVSGIKYKLFLVLESATYSLFFVVGASWSNLFFSRCPIVVLLTTVQTS